MKDTAPTLPEIAYTSRIVKERFIYHRSASDYAMYLIDFAGYSDVHIEFPSFENHGNYIVVFTQRLVSSKV